MSFLAEEAGPFQRHETALMRALALIEASRAVWAENRAFRERRAGEKERGARMPRRGEAPPMVGGYWYETRPDVARRAALHALTLWEQDAEQPDPLVRQCVATGGRLTVEQVAGARDPWTARLMASAIGLSWHDFPHCG